MRNYWSLALLLSGLAIAQPVQGPISANCPSCSLIADTILANTSVSTNNFAITHGGGFVWDSGQATNDLVGPGNAKILIGSSAIRIYNFSSGSISFTVGNGNNDSLYLNASNAAGNPQVDAAAGQTLGLCTANASENCTIGVASSTMAVNAGTVTWGTVKWDWTFPAFDPLSGVTTTGNFASMGPTKTASTVQDVTYVQGVAGTGGTTQTLKLCDTSGCGSGVIYATCTPTCTSTAGTVTACTINTSAMAASKTLFWAITATTCTTDSSGNLTAHMSTP